MKRTLTKNNFSTENHPWNWHIPEKATKLFIGTHPTDIRNRKHDFFYCSSTNRFWEVLSAISGYVLLNGKNAIEERKNILDKLKLGLTDMGRTIYRQVGSSKDHSIFPYEFMDIPQILSKNISLETLIVSGSKQGNSSFSWFSIFCSLNKIEMDIDELEKHKSTEIFMAERKIRVLHAYSPSRLSRIKTDKLIDCYNSLINAKDLT